VTASPACYDLIRSFESLKLEPYLCPSGLPSQGYGHTHGVSLTDPPCTPEEAEMWLREDVGTAESIIDGRVHVPLTQGQHDALVSFVFNLGGAKFTDTGCTLLRWLNQGLPSEQIAEQFDRWVYGTDPQTGKPIKLSGLVRRRAAEKALFLSDSI